MWQSLNQLAVFVKNHLIIDEIFSLALKCPIKIMSVVWCGGKKDSAPAKNLPSQHILELGKQTRVAYLKCACSIKSSELLETTLWLSERKLQCKCYEVASFCDSKRAEVNGSATDDGWREVEREGGMSRRGREI